jgi:hypothetical protein
MKEALQRALDALGPTPPECCGCQAEWQIAIDAVKEGLREHALGEVQRFGEEMEETGAAVEAEREACANLRKEVALLGKRSTEYEEGFWDGLGKYEDLIRARSKND